MFNGSIMVIGTPAEELYGGKVIMADRGAFKNIDAAIRQGLGAWTLDYLGQTWGDVFW